MYIITSKTRSKIKRDPNSQKQLSEERKQYFKEQGLEKIIPLKGQTEEETFEQVKGAGSFVKENMDAQKELTRNNKAKKWKDGQNKRIKEAPDKFFKAKEERLKDNQKKTKIDLSK